jgi:hypothetical protein
MERKNAYFTNYHCFSLQEAELIRDKVSFMNQEILIAHICNPNLAKEIEGFLELNGTLFLCVNGEIIAVSHNLNHPRHSN